MSYSPEGFIPLVKKLDKTIHLLHKHKHVKRSEDTDFCAGADFVMTVFCEGCKSRWDIVEKLIENFKPVHLWEVVARVSTCDCCQECSRKFGGKKEGCCKCACFELYEVFTMALEKEAYDRLARIEGRPSMNEIVALARLRKVSKD